MARGHSISHLPEIPFVIADADIDAIAKTKDAIALLSSFGVGEDLERVAASRQIRTGKGKSRNRRYVQRRGPLLIHNKERGNDGLRFALKYSRS
jgi:large subunit ribosomal protein L4e